MRCFVSILIMVGVLGAEILAADQRVDVVPQEQWSNFYGGKEVVLHFSISAHESFKGVAGWVLSSGGRTLARGERAVAVEPGRAESLEVRFEAPNVKEGVALQGILNVSVFKQDSKGAAGSCEKNLWFFPRDAFAGQKERLKERNINLFDPEKKTVAVFSKAGIPFNELGNINVFEEVKNGVLIIGEGISFKDYRGLYEAMIKPAAGGIPVLCLSPAGGDIVLPSADSDLPRPVAMFFKGKEVVRELDKRLDADAWAPEGKTLSSVIKLRGERDGIAGEVAKDDNGWPWVEMEFAGKAGNNGQIRQSRLIVCGFGIIEKWENGPAPQFLMLKLIEKL